MPLNRDDADGADCVGGPWPAGLRVWLVGIVVKFPDEGRIVRFGRADAGLGVLGGEVFFEAADQQFKLFDVAVELFRGAAEACASQRRQLHLQLFDMQRLGMDLRGIGGELDLLARQFGLQVSGKKLQRLRVGR